MSSDVHPVPLRLDFRSRLSKHGISSSDRPSDSALLLFFLPLYRSVRRSPAQLSQFTFSLTSLSSLPICFWPLAYFSYLSACFLTPSAVTFPVSCLLPLAVSLSVLLSSSFCFSLCLLRAEVSAPQY